MICFLNTTHSSSYETGFYVLKWCWLLNAEILILKRTNSIFLRLSTLSQLVSELFSSCFAISWHEFFPLKNRFLFYYRPSSHILTTFFTLIIIAPGFQTIQFLLLRSAAIFRVVNVSICGWYAKTVQIGLKYTKDAT
jgi:hypothetical protein